MKHNYVKKMNRFWVIGDSKKVVFWKKVRFYFFIKLLLHTFFFFQKTDFLLPDHLFWMARITRKRFIFEESYTSYGKHQKSCTL